jgi:O-antigen ligase
MALFFGVYLVRRKPAVAMAAVLAMAISVPMLPSSYWNRLSSITDDSKDETGSREARRTLLKESFATFVSHPLTGVGAGQFKNYNPGGREQAWRESHNVLLQVAAELGVFGLLVFGFLVARAAYAPVQVRALLRRAAPRARRRRLTTFGQQSPSPDPEASASALAPAEEASLQAHAAAISAAMAGWFVCALFASVAYHWTFYYLLALALAPREVLIERLKAAGTSLHHAASTAGARR